MTARSLAGKTCSYRAEAAESGLPIALRAARDGANVALIAKTAEPHPKLEGTIYTAAEAIEEAGGQALPIVGDIRDEQQVLAAVDSAVERFGGIDVCVNNASAINLAGTEALEMKRYDLMQDINTRGTFLVSKACIPHLKQAANPHVLTLSPPLQLDPKWFKAARRLHDREVRHEHVHARHGGGVPRRRHRLQLAVAAHDHRDRRGPEPPRRRRGDGALAQPRDLCRRRPRGRHPAEPGDDRQLLPLRGRACGGGRDRPVALFVRRPGRRADPGPFVE